MVLSVPVHLSAVYLSCLNISVQRCAPVLRCSSQHRQYAWPCTNWCNFNCSDLERSLLHLSCQPSGAVHFL